MRILFVTASYLPDSVGGVELHVAGLARAMADLGHSPWIFSAAHRPGVPHLDLCREEVDGIPVVRMNNTFEDVDRFDRMYAHEGIADVFAGSLQADPPDVVHIHHLTCLSLRIIDRIREAGVPCLMTLHDFWMGCPRGQRITAGLDVCPTIRLEKCLPCLRELWPHLLGRSRMEGVPAEERDAADLALLEEYHATVHRVLGALDLVVTPSAFMKRMAEETGLDARRVRVVENGLPLGRWDGAGGEAQGAGPLRVGFIGSVLPSKGVHLLVEAYQRLGDPTSMRLDIWGEVLPFHNDRTYGERLAALTAGWESRIAFHGRYHNDDLPSILRELDVVVVPSLWYEAFALTIREAFLAGVPVVTANHGAMAEAVRDGKTGLLFEAGDVASLSQALARLAGDPALRRALATSHPPVRDEREAAGELLRIYDALVADRRRDRA